MINFFKYLPVSEDDERWGLCVLNTGCTRIGPNSPYPGNSHPAPHYFSWENGRILQEYQLIYITNGEGVFESQRTGLVTVKEGSIILLFPNERHRYKPNENTGWDEYWIGFKGEIVNSLIERNFFIPESPIAELGFNESVISIFSEIIEKSKEERPGYQAAISGAALHLLGLVFSTMQQKAFCDDENIIKLVDKARLIFRTNLERSISPEEVAKELNIGYSYFRKIFKAYSGIAPGQYLIQLKIQKAKELLAGSNRSIKEIAFDLNFDSSFYFSKIFKEKTSFTPNEYRKVVKW